MVDVRAGGGCQAGSGCQSRWWMLELEFGGGRQSWR